MNPRPSTLERWGLDYAVGARAAPAAGDAARHRLRRGRARERPARASARSAEAMSGFAHVTGQPDGPPTLPPFMLADGVAALAATYAVMMALYHRDVHAAGRPAHRRQPDRAARPAARTGRRSPTTSSARSRPAPATGSTPAHRATPTAPPTTMAGHVERRLDIAMRALTRGRPPGPGTRTRVRRPGRGSNAAAEIDALVAEWIGRHTLDEAMAVFEEPRLAAAPIYDAAAAPRRRALPRAGSSRRSTTRTGPHDGCRRRCAVLSEPRGDRPPRVGSSAPTTTRSTATCSASTPRTRRALRDEGVI